MIKGDHSQRSDRPLVWRLMCSQRVAHAGSISFHACEVRVPHSVVGERGLRVWQLVLQNHTAMNPNLCNVDVK